MIGAADIGTQAANRIVKVADELRGVSQCRPSMQVSFGFRELGNVPSTVMAEQLRGVVGRKCLSIYSFHLDSYAKRAEFLNIFEAAKSEKLGNLAYPRLNKAVDNLSADCLYVGTSRDTEKRLREHLGFGDNRTYSLHLAKWATLLAGGIEVRIHPFELPQAQLHLLPYLEDALAEELKPLLGRRGNL